jgi:glycosyltransferase involved in cell wall biosynthesis
MIVVEFKTTYERKQPLVTVLMPCKNAVATIGEAIRSVQEQTLQDWELIASDDGSDDGTQDVIASISEADPRITLLEYQGRQRGASAARNRALDSATGRYIAFLDADDLWLPTKLEVQIGAMQSQSSPFSCSAYWVRRERRADLLRQPPKHLTRQLLLKGNRIGCLTVIYDSKVFGKQPMPDIPLRHDYALWLHLLKLTPTAIGLQEVLAIHHRHSGSLSSNIFRASLATWHMLRTEAGLPPLAAANTLMRHLLGRIYRG